MQYNPLSVNAASLRFIASLINTCKGLAGHSSWYHQRTQFDITPALIDDEPLRQVFMAIEHGANGNAGFMFTPYEIATHMAELGFVSGQDLPAAIRAAAQTIEDIGQSGASNKAEFLRLEGLLTEVIKDAKASGIMAELGRIWNAREASSHMERIDQLADYINAIRGQFVPQTRSAGAEGQGAILRQMDLDLTAREGQLEETFPRHFGVFSQTMKPKRKEMVCISGPSGGGKSILIHLFAEWWARVLHKRVLFLLTEDSLETTLLRAAARHIPFTTFKEVDEVDRRGKKDAYAQMLLDWKAQGGEIVYKEVSGMTPTAIRNLMEKELTQAMGQGIPFDAVLCDYFQDVDFDTEAENIKGATRVTVAARFAVQLRAIAPKYNVVMVVASQETTDGDEVKTAWSKRLTEKSQIWLRFQTAVAAEDVLVYLRYNGKGHMQNDIPRMVARAGEDLPFMFLSVAKGNRGRRGQRECLYRLGPSQAAYALDFFKLTRQHPDKEWEPIVFERAGDDFYQKQQEVFDVAAATVEQIDAWALDPVKNKGKKRQYNNTIPG